MWKPLSHSLHADALASINVTLVNFCALIRTYLRTIPFGGFQSVNHSTLEGLLAS